MVNENATFLSLTGTGVTLMERRKREPRYSGEGTLFEALQMSAIGISAPCGKGFAVSAYADIRHEHLVFERQQSLALREREWEDRIQPLLPWSALIMRGLGVTIFVAAILGMLV
jgi:hypothetical protein